MKRLDVWACSPDAEVLSEKLIRLRSVDVETAPLDEETVFRYDSSEKIRDCEKRLEKVAAALDSLYKYSKRKKSFGKQKIRANLDAFVSAGHAERAWKITEEVLSVKDRQTAAEKEKNAAIGQIRALGAWTGLDLPVGFAGTAKTRMILGSLPLSVKDGTVEERLDGLAVAFRQISASSTARYMCFEVLNTDAEMTLRRLNLMGFVRAEFPEGDAMAADLIRKYEKKVSDAEKETDELERKLSELAVNIDDLEILSDVIGTELEEARMRERLASTGRCVILKGWFPADREEKVSAVLQKIDCAYEISDPDENDNVPVRLENNSFARNFEWVVAMYSLPAYGTYDPTFIMGICYVILFSLMMADVGYGLLLVLGGFLAPKLLKLPEGTKRAFNMFGWCGVGCIISGVLFGGYFGDLPVAIMKAYFPDVTPPETLALLVDPVLDPMTYLIVGLAVGVIHLITGQAVQFSILWKKGQKLDAIFDIGFIWLLYAGIVLFVVFRDVGKWVLIAAVTAIIIAGGRNEKNIIKKPLKGLLALYGLISFGSDIISYSRILAIALSGTVLAQVFNILSTMVTVPVAGPIVMVIILLVGHILNLVLSALSGFVHTSRLQYVEFFGKFYIDGGKPYVPMLPSSRFTEPELD